MLLMLLMKKTTKTVILMLLLLLLLLLMMMMMMMMMVVVVVMMSYAFVSPVWLESIRSWVHFGLAGIVVGSPSHPTVVGTLPRTLWASSHVAATSFGLCDAWWTRQIWWRWGKSESELRFRIRSSERKVTDIPLVNSQNVTPRANKVLPVGFHFLINGMKHDESSPSPVDKASLTACIYLYFHVINSLPNLESSLKE